MPVDVVDALTVLANTLNIGDVVVGDDDVSAVCLNPSLLATNNPTVDVTLVDCDVVRFVGVELLGTVIGANLDDGIEAKRHTGKLDVP
jgi:hypothetical protein